MGGVLVLLILVIFCFITSCSVFFRRDGHGLDHFLHCRGRGHSGAEADYQALEEALRPR